MFINENVLKGSWKQIKGEMQTLWGNITDDEWDRAQGSATSLAGLVQKKYGLSETEVQSKFNDIFTKFSSKSEQQPDRSSGENVESYKH